VDEILSFEAVSAAQAACALKDAAQGAYDAVKDVPGFVRGLRGEDEK
jgi:hypothetical protein